MHLCGIDPTNEDQQFIEMDPDNLEAHLATCQLIYHATSPNATDNGGRDRTDIATSATNPEVRRWASTFGVVYGRYKLLDDGKPIYKSNTCAVYLADDVMINNEIQLLKDDDPMMKELESLLHVCIKVLPDYENFKSEQDARLNEKNEPQNFDEKYVVGVFAEYTPYKGIVHVGHAKEIQDKVTSNETENATITEMYNPDGSIAADNKTTSSILVASNMKDNSEP